MAGRGKIVRKIFIVTLFLFSVSACAGVKPGINPAPIIDLRDGYVCRQIVVADCLFLGETYPLYCIAVDPTISKHAAARYYDAGKWHWYRETPEHFTPVFFFDLKEYIEWYIKNYHGARKY